MTNTFSRSSVARAGSVDGILTGMIAAAGRGAREAPRRCLSGPERLVEVPEDVVDVLDADAQPHEVGAHAGRGLLVGRELAVRGRRGMDREALRVADVGEVAEQLQALDELLAGLDAALDAEAHDRPAALRQVLLRP